MNKNILSYATSFLNNDDVVGSFANQLNEPKTNIKEGLGAIVPSLLLSLQGMTTNGLSSVLGKFKNIFEGFNFSQINNSGANLLSNSGMMDKITQLIPDIFGDKLSTLTNALSRNTSLKEGSIMSLIGMALPNVVSSLTNKGTNWDASSIKSALDSEKLGFASAIPSAIGLSAFGSYFTSLKNQAGDVVGNIKDSISDTTKDVYATTRKNGNRIWFWLLLAGLAIVLWFLLGKSCQDKVSDVADSTKNAVTSAVNTTTDAVGDAVTSVKETVGSLLDFTLPNGEKVSYEKNSIEDKVITFLNKDYEKSNEEELSKTWFDFDKINFISGTATLTEDSYTQLNNLVNILKAYPNAKIKIGGYTDRTGNAKINQKLSQDRADAVAQYFKSHEVEKQIAGTEGYGDQFAKYPADAPESDRISDRRVSISFRK